MICPKCKRSKMSKVLETRERLEQESVYRRRECVQCGFRYVTEEKFLRGLPSNKKDR